MDMTKLAQMSCNPAMGGIAKGQIVREIDAMGGMSGIVTDRSMIQFRMLNKSKGPAMWSPRAQCDSKDLLRNGERFLREQIILQSGRNRQIHYLLEGKKVVGVETAFGTRFYSEAVILTNGTFLNGLMHIGFSKIKGGRSGDQSSTGLSEQLEELGFSVERMKTGTSARVDGRSIDFSEMTEQKGDDEGRSFSYLLNNPNLLEQKSCYITHTNEEVHEEIRKGFEFSPLFTGRIKGRGPRYCPSIEDKVVTFKERNSHQLFIEPEGEDTVEYYINGFQAAFLLKFN